MQCPLLQTELGLVQRLSCSQVCFAKYLTSPAATFLPVGYSDSTYQPATNCIQIAGRACKSLTAQSSAFCGQPCAPLAYRSVHQLILSVQVRCCRGPSCTYAGSAAGDASLLQACAAVNGGFAA